MIREGAGCYLTLAICEDTGSRKLANLGKSRSLGLPVPAGHECLQILLRTVFMRPVKAQGLLGPRTGVQTGVGQQVLSPEAQIQGVGKDDRRTWEPQGRSHSQEPAGCWTMSSRVRGQDPQS